MIWLNWINRKSATTGYFFYSSISLTRWLSIKLSLFHQNHFHCWEEKNQILRKRHIYIYVCVKISVYIYVSFVLSASWSVSWIFLVSRTMRRNTCGRWSNGTSTCARKKRTGSGAFGRAGLFLRGHEVRSCERMFVPGPLSSAHPGLSKELQTSPVTGEETTFDLSFHWPVLDWVRAPRPRLLLLRSTSQLG